MKPLPRLLVLDDLFGRVIADGPNTDRENLCATFLWQDASGDESAKASRQKVLKPVAEAAFCRSQTPAFAKVGDTVQNDLEVALKAVRGGWHQVKSASGRLKAELPWSMVLLDLCFYTGLVTEESHRQTPGMPEGRTGDEDSRSYFGLTLLDAIHREFPDLPIFILSSKPREEVSLEFSRRGALGFIARDDLRGPELLQEALWQHALLPDANGLVAGHSLPLLLALREARRAALHEQAVLITGESGTGKELIARSICTFGPRATKPFLALNCAAIPRELIESELFGHEKGAFTGAISKRIGKFEQCDGGTLFLDEIGDMSNDAQTKLLRVLQSGTFEPVGSEKTTKVDVRVIAATNRELGQEVESGRFREDLLFRLNSTRIHMPPLRERMSDIAILAEQFAREAEKARPGSMRRDIAPEAMERLVAYDWPGNVRELRTCIFDAVNRHPDVEHLVEPHLRMEGEPAPASPRSVRRRGQPPAPTAGDDGIAGLVSRMKAGEFPAKDIGKWAGQLHDLQREHAWLLARYLQAALDATKRRTPESPEGQIQIHPAVKLITGDSLLTASKAADVVKRLLNPLEGELTGDLAEAYATSIRLRPKSARRTSAKSD
jgi:DNA-binding NtrC family response regulator